MTTRDDLLTIPEVQSRLGGVSRATIYRMIDRGDLPEPIKLGPRMTRFRQSDIDQALAKLAPGRLDPSQPH